MKLEQVNDEADGGVEEFADLPEPCEVNRDLGRAIVAFRTVKGHTIAGKTIHAASVLCGAVFKPVAFSNDLPKLIEHCRAKFSPSNLDE